VVTAVTAVTDGGMHGDLLEREAIGRRVSHVSEGRTRRVATSRSNKWLSAEPATLNAAAPEFRRRRGVQERDWRAGQQPHELNDQIMAGWVEAEASYLGGWETQVGGSLGGGLRMSRATEKR
jgi:hypothetical protein